MDTLERLDAADLKGAMVGFRDALRSHQAAINRLNVYPVPDGDTGTNMALTLESVVAQIESDGASDLAGVGRSISHGSLMGARGNSGVILSQILRGLVEGCDQGEPLGGAELARALSGASDGARSAVMRPVEGTILTVARESAEGAVAAAGEGCGLLQVIERARLVGGETLARTPEMLPVLASAGVVDAGGSGYLLLLDALLSVVDGRPLPDAPAVGELDLPGPVGMAPIEGRIDHDAIGDLRYEVMYLLEATDDLVPAFKEVWAGIGDSIVVVGGDGLWNCHIHTDDIGAAVEAALDAGRPRSIRVTDLMDQVEEERWVREAEPSLDTGSVGPPVATAVVAVATGDGIRRIFRSLGVHHVVAGGQSMNPSVAQLLEAIDAAPSDEVVILPNNSNIIPVAEQAVELSSKTVRVVGTKGIAEGFAALLEYDPEAGSEMNAANMNQAATRVVAGEVTKAVRASHSEAGPIAEGDWLGLSRSGIEVVAHGLCEAACGLLNKLVGPQHEIVTVIEGEGATAADTRRITEWVAENHAGVAVEVHHGGQALYPYLFSID
ncbi:MAG: DAK2 domain-containing protein [Acidimicrobiales bacterium]